MTLSKSGGHNVAPEPFELWWDSGYCGFEVVGEHYRRPDVARVVKRNGGSLDRPGNLSITMNLVREPSNRFDPGAVAVLADGVIIGYVRKEDAPAYHEPLDRLASLNCVANVTGEISWWTGYGEDDPTFRVTIDLGAPTRIVPVNPAPEAARLLPRGRSLAVKEHAEALPALSHMLHSAPGNEASAWALLTAAADLKGKEVTSVVIDDVQVGTLTPASSAHFLPVTRWGADHGVPIACRALLVGNELDVQVTIHAAKASELPSEWLIVEPSPPEEVRQPTPARATPAGWQADPSARHQLRYWDGTRWTEHVHDHGIAAVDPL